MDPSPQRDLDLAEAVRTFDRFKEAYAWEDADIAAALQVDRGALQRYRTGEIQPTVQVRNSIADLRELSILLEEIFLDEPDAMRWLNRPVPLLNDRRPIDLVRSGRLHEVITVLATYHSGAFL